MFKSILLALLLTGAFALTRADNLWHCSRVDLCNTGNFGNFCHVDFQYWDCKDFNTRISIEKYCYNHACFPTNCQCDCDEGTTGGSYSYCNCSNGAITTRGFTCFCI